MEVPEWIRQHREQLTCCIGALWSLGLSVLFLMQF